MSQNKYKQIWEDLDHIKHILVHIIIKLEANKILFKILNCM